jgi:hypothetical protein
MNQHTPQLSNRKKGKSFAEKPSDASANGSLTGPVNPRMKDLPSKPRQTASTQYMVIQISPELAKQAQQRKPIAKSEEAKAMFAKYRASK